MQIFKKTPQIDFVKFRVPTAILSLLIILIGTLGFFLRGINLGIDFQGGINAQVQFSEEVNIRQLRDLLAPKLGSEFSVTYFGNKANNEFLISISSEGEKNYKEYIAVSSKIPLNNFSTGTHKVGPKVGSELSFRRITHNGKQGSYDNKIEFFTKQNKNRSNDQNIVKNCQNST